MDRRRNWPSPPHIPRAAHIAHAFVRAGEETPSWPDPGEPARDSEGLADLEIPLPPPNHAGCLGQGTRRRRYAAVELWEGSPSHPPAIAKIRIRSPGGRRATNPAARWSSFPRLLARDLGAPNAVEGDPDRPWPRDGGGCRCEAQAECRPQARSNLSAMDANASAGTKAMPLSSATTISPGTT